MAEDNDVLAELDAIVENTGSGKQKKPRPASDKEQEYNRWLTSVVDEAISDGYIYSGSERQTQQAEAWRRYFRQPYGNEQDGYSTYVSDLVQTKVDQARAFITEQYYRNSSPIIKFTPSSVDDADEAEMATRYVNYVFRNKLDGHRIIDETVMNAALLKMCPVRVYMKEKRSQEVVEFRYEGKTEDLENALAAFIVANDDVTDKDPYESVEKELDDGKMYACYKWKRENIVERFPEVDVISPENFFISRQATSLEEAKVTAIITNMMLSHVKEQYPDAPLLNGFKDTKKDRAAFWEQMQSDYQTWYSETTWFAKWSYDSLQFFEQYDNQNDETAGLGTKAIFVVDAEIFIGDKDNKNADAKLYHIVKAGPMILHKEEIAERSFLCGSLLPTANRWLGISLWDKVEQEAREVTNLTRAMTDAAAQAAHPNIAFDPGVYNADDVFNRSPDSVIRVIEGAVPQQGVAALEVVKLPGPDPTVQASMEVFKNTADDTTGVGKGLQAASAADISDMRLDKDTAQTQMQQSTQLLNFMARNYANFLCQVLVKILNTAIKGGASPQLLGVAGAWMKVEPVGMRARADFVLDVDIGVNEAQDKLRKAQGIMQAIGMLQGGNDPTTGQPLGVTAELLPTAGYEIGKLMLEAYGAKDMVEKVLVQPEVAQDPQVQAAIQGAVEQANQAAQAQMAQMEQQLRQQIEMEMKVAEQQAKLAVESRKLMLEERKQTLAEDNAAFQIAVQAEAEERREEEAAYRSASEELKAEAADKKVDLDYEIKKQEMELQREIAEVNAEPNVTAVVSP